jgi:uncharacterized protein with PhoU and TrkA domain
VSRRRRGGRRLPKTLVVALALLVVVFGAGHTATSSFTAGDTQRGSGVDVVSDEAAVHALDVAAAVHVNATDPLVNVTNRLGRSVSVTVSLRSESTDVGELVVDGVAVGDSATFTLNDGGAETVRIDVPDDANLTDRTVYFDADASDTGLEVRAPNRSAPVNG